MSDKFLFRSLAATLATTLWAAAAQGAFIETVPIGNPGNLGEQSRLASHGDTTYYGGVDYVYNMGKYEVTAGQYTEFLNAVAALDTNVLYNTSMAESTGCGIIQGGSSGTYTYSVAPDWADRPVNFVNVWDAARFANWLHNGQPTGPQGPGTTEDGAYLGIGGITTFARQPGAQYFIPTEDEWYKAAYHQNNGPTADYFHYATSNDSRPSHQLVDPDPGNNATYRDFDQPSGSQYTIGSPYYRTEGGAHENSGSPYGTFDQTGNVREWTETAGSAVTQIRRDGPYSNSYLNLDATYRSAENSYEEIAGGGFRIANIPEPGGVTLLAWAALGLLGYRLPRGRQRRA